MAEIAEGGSDGNFFDAFPKVLADVAHNFGEGYVWSCMPIWILPIPRIRHWRRAP